MDRIRRLYAELIDSYAAIGDMESVRECSSLAVKHGIWKDPMQRPLHFVPTIPGAPIHDGSEFWFIRHLEENFETIRKEVDQVTDPRRSGFRPVDEPLLDQGRWEQVVFYEEGQRSELECRRFPAIAKLIDAIPEITTEGPGVVTLSWLYPGSHIIPHCGGSNAKLRIHLGIRIPDGVSMRVKDQHFVWKEGKCTLFDDSFEHEVWHKGTEPRIVLLLDIFNPALTPSEKAALMQKRASLQEKIKSFMTDRRLKRIEKEASGRRVRLFPDAETENLIRRHMDGSGIRAVELRAGEVNVEYD